MRKFCVSHYLSFLRMREWRDIHEQISQVLAEEPGFAMNTQPAAPEWLTELRMAWRAFDRDRDAPGVRDRMQAAAAAAREACRK